MNVPLFVPWISNDDINSISSALKSPQLTDGPMLRKFESQFSKLTKSKFSIGVSNGTEALHLSLVALGIGKGDEVIIPDMTFIATSNAVVLSGAKPVLSDIDSSLNISTDSIQKNITKKTKAIIPVHFAGLSCNMKKIIQIAKKNNLKIIEDCAHSIGTYFDKKHVGTFGDAGCFSFYPTKNITTIEGGMITTNSKITAKKLQSLRNHGLSRTLLQRNKTDVPWEYDIDTPGYNFRLDEIRATLGISQLKRLKTMNRMRKNAANYYSQKLKNIPGIEIPNLSDAKNHVYHLYIIRIKPEFGLSRNIIHKKLFKKRIHTTVHYKPLHTFLFFKNSLPKNKQFPNSLNAFTECLSLPLYPKITRIQQDYVIDNLLKLQK
jgi:dTDP-4-amino-4,6-dideoxygalactose transaminase